MPSVKLPCITDSNLARRPSQKTREPLIRSASKKVSEDLILTQLIGDARFLVFLCFSSSKNKHFAVKLFDFEESQNQYFVNEARFAGIRHPNIIQYLYADDQTSFPVGKEDITVSCLVMEYAPYGDLFKFVRKLGEDFSEKLARTYFRQLIEGLEFLHDSGVYHLDLKLENLLIAEDGQLRIADFDLSYVEGDSHIISNGTRFYRAPELRASKKNVGAPADIYSVGIILFVMKCRGLLPHLEGRPYRGYDLQSLLNTDHKRFFEAHMNIQVEKASFFDEDFKQLFISMTKEDPNERIQIKDIKKSKWYKGSVYSPKKLKNKVFKIFNH